MLVVILNENHLEKGYECHPMTNIADFAMDALHGVFMKDGIASIVRTENIAAQLTDFWDVNERAQIEAAIQSNRVDKQKSPPSVLYQPSASFFTTFKFVCSRQFKVKLFSRWDFKFGSTKLKKLFG